MTDRELMEQKPVAWQERQGRRMRDGVVPEWSPWYQCENRSFDEVRSKVCDGIPYEWRPLYTAPRQWQGLTDEEIVAVYGDDLKYRDGDYLRYSRAIEAKLKERNK